MKLMCGTLGLRRLVEVKSCSALLTLICTSQSAGPRVGPVKVRAGVHATRISANSG